MNAQVHDDTHDDTHSVDDDGLAGPRTSLAWQRTALAGVIGALASLRFALSCHADGVTEVITIALAVAATALAIVVVAQARTTGRLGAADTRDGRFKLAVVLMIVALVISHLLGSVQGC